MVGNTNMWLAVSCWLSAVVFCSAIPTNLDSPLDDFDSLLDDFDVNYTGDETFSLASYYGDHMVLQKAPAQAVIWGHAPTSGLGQTVTVRLESVGELTTTISPGPVADTAVWRAKLPPVSDHLPKTITVTWGSQQLTLADVLFGDVWVCSGQSNMQFSMIQVFNATEELSEVIDYPDIRVFTAALRYSAKPVYELLSVEEKWSVPSEATIGNKKAFSYFSAVCWLYGKYLYQTLGYPIGLVDTDWGGTPVEAWSSPDALAKCGLRDTLLYKPRRGPITRLHGQDDPSQLWNAMVHPLLNMTIYGAIWYQGEANAGKPHTYNCTFPAMISDWRQKFHEGSLGETDPVFPFGFVQLAANRKEPSVVTGFPDIRWHQTADYGYVPNPKMPNTFMSVAMDLPDFTSPYGSIHPRDKEDVCQRLVLSGLSVAYNRPGIKFQGPLLTSFYANQRDKTILIGFDNGTSPIEVRSANGFEVCCGSLEVCADTGPGWKAAPIIDSDQKSVTLSYSLCGAIKPVDALRYAWRESPCPFKLCAVYSKVNGLPAPPFVIRGTHIGTAMETWQDIQSAIQRNR